MAEKKKSCARCRRNKVLSEFGKDRHSKDGLRAYCKPCANEIRRQSADKTRAYNEKNDVPGDATRACSGCGETKELTEFVKNPGLRLGRGHYCPECRRDMRQSG